MVGGWMRIVVMVGVCMVESVCCALCRDACKLDIRQTKKQNVREGQHPLMRLAEREAPQLVGAEEQPAGHLVDDNGRKR